jgi:hypothetical protein
MRRIVFASLVLLAAAFAAAQENYATAWTRHRTIFLNTTAANGAGVDSTARNFPVLVRLRAADSATFAQARSGGVDLRFTKANNTTRLPHQIDHWDSAGRSAAVWVLVDTIRGNNSTQSIRMHWGNAAAADSSNGTVVFSNGFTNVWHLGNAAGTGARPNAISGGNAATPTNFPGVYTPPAGIIGKAEYLRGGPGYSTGIPTASSLNDHLNLGSITANYANGFTFSAWIFPEIIGNNTAYYTASEAANGTATPGLIVLGLQGNEGSAGAKFRQRNGGSGSNTGILSTNGEMLPTLGGWHHVLATLDAAGEMAYYLDGALVNVASGITAYSSVTRPVNLLGTSLAHMQYVDTSFHGSMDEARLANVGRPAYWARLEYANQRAAQTLVFFDSVPVAIAPAAPRLSSAFFSVKPTADRVTFRVGHENTAGARVTVLDMRGRTVWNAAFGRGAGQLVWNGRGANGQMVSAGVYAVRLTLLDARGSAFTTVDRKLPLTW